MSDREYGTNFLTVHSVALAAWAAMLAGKVALFQQRLGGSTRYIARSLPTPHKEVKWVGSYDTVRFQFKLRSAA